MAVLAIFLLGLGTFGLITGVVKRNGIYISVSACMITAGAILGIICLIKEGVI